ncbi:UNVERIFIED_CONTAM: hypothetical protein O8I53_11515 [Campylobacter lari]
MNSFRFVLENHKNNYFSKVDDFFNLKKKQLNAIRLNPEKYRFTSNALINYQK